MFMGRNSGHLLPPWKEMSTELSGSFSLSSLCSKKRASGRRSAFQRRSRWLSLDSGGQLGSGGDGEPRDLRPVYIPSPSSLGLVRLGLALLPASRLSEPIICLLVPLSVGGWIRMADIPWFLPAEELDADVPPKVGPWMILLLRS